MKTTYLKQWNFLQAKQEAEQLAHAYLFSGKDVDGIKNFSKEFIQYLQCSSPLKPCDTCWSCMMIQKEIFPDLMVVKSANSESSIKNERDMMEIEVKQIRDVQNFLSFKSYYGKSKVVIIENAERMTLEAQNCFLKNLEEPKGKTVIFLLSSMSDLMLSTIASRCQQMKFLSNDSKEISIQDKKVLDALLPIISADMATKFQYVKSANLEREQVNNILSILQKYFRQLLFSNMISVTDEAKSSMVKLKKIIELIENIHYQISFTNVNHKLALEIVLMEI